MAKAKPPVIVHRTQPPWLLAFLIAAATFIAFWPALSNQFLAWDDDVNFTNNPHFRGLGWDNLRWMFTSFHSGHYQPIAWLTLGWDCEWGQRVFGAHPTWGPGMDPRAFHITSNLLHAINAALVYLLALRILSWAKNGIPTARDPAIQIGAAIAALLFGLHPIRVENVAWITERRDLVGALFLLLTVLAYLHAVEANGARRWRWIGVSLILYVVSLMAKVSGVPLVAALIALDWYPLRRSAGTATHTRRSVWMEKCLYALVALVFAFIAVKGQAENQWLYPLEAHPLPARLVQMCYGLAFYLWKTYAPFELLPLYELHRPMVIAQPRFIGAMAMVAVGVLAVAALAVRGKRRGLAVAMICYAAFLGPVLGLFQNGPQIVADRYSYLPSIGIVILVAGSAVWFMTLRPTRARTVVSVIGAGAICLGLGALTWQQCKIWRTTHTLWSHVLQKDPGSAVAHDNFGIALAMEGEVSDSIPYFRRAIEIDPYFKMYREHLRRALRETGKTQDVVAAWIDEARFGEYTAHYHFTQGLNALQAKDAARAAEHFTVSAMLDPRQASTQHNLAIALERLGRADEAMTHYVKSIELDPAQPNPRFDLAAALARHRRVPEAIAQLRELLRIAPDHAAARNLLEQLERPSP